MCYLLDAEGLDCWLVNTSEVKNVPGRTKTDRADGVWLTKVAERGTCRPSSVQPPEIGWLRDLTRYRRALVQDPTRERQPMETSTAVQSAGPALSLRGRASVAVTSLVSQVEVQVCRVLGVERVESELLPLPEVGRAEHCDHDTSVRRFDVERENLCGAPSAKGAALAD